MCVVHFVCFVSYQNLSFAKESLKVHHLATTRIQKQNKKNKKMKKNETLNNCIRLNKKHYTEEDKIDMANL